MRYVNLQLLTLSRVYNRLWLYVCVCVCVYKHISWSDKSTSPPLSKGDLNNLMHLRKHAKLLNVYQTQLYIPRILLQLMGIQIQEIGYGK